MKRIKFEDVEKNRIEFKSHLSSIKIGGNKSDEQLSEIENITKLYDSWEKVIKVYNDYFEMVHKAAYTVNIQKD